jgi:hypothetical protein
MDLSTIINNRSNEDKKTTTGLNAKKEKYKEIDMLYEDLKDLCNSQFRLWYCKQFNKLGREKILRLASEARADAMIDKRKLFSHLIRKELKK